MKRAVVTLLVLMGCAGEDPGRTTQAIYGGATDSGDPNVPMLFYFAPDDTSHTSGFICTGSVVGKRTLLTAAHCVQENVDAGKAADGFAYFGNGDWRTDTANRIKFVGAHYHRQYVTASGGLGTSDVAVIYLEADAPADPVVVNEDPLELLVTPTTTLRAVGWGDVATTGAGTKRTATVVFGGVSSYDTFYIGDGRAGTCHGDSGGPSFIKVGGVERQAGVTSYGPMVCNQGHGAVVRVDKYVKSFIYPYVDYFEGPCRTDGVCVTTGCRTEDPDCNGCGEDTGHTCNPMCDVPDWDCPIGLPNGQKCQTKYDCETRICEAAKDDPRLKFCSQECVPSQPNCLPEQTCEDVNGQSLCVFKAPSPGAQGSPCSSGALCRSGLCAPSTHICVEECDPSQANSCPSVYECQESSVAPHVCDTPSAGGGCGVAGGRGGTALGLLVALFALTLRRR